MNLYPSQYLYWDMELYRKKGMADSSKELVISKALILRNPNFVQKILHVHIKSSLFPFVMAI